MNVLITFPGSQDPYTGGLNTKPGPILSLLAQRAFDSVYLLSTPGTNEATRATEAAILGMHPESNVELISTGLEVPTDFIAVKTLLESTLAILKGKHRTDDLWVCMSTDRPQIDACWLSLADRWFLRLRLLEVRLPRTVSAELPEVREVMVYRPGGRPNAAMRIPKWTSGELREDAAVQYCVPGLFDEPDDHPSPPSMSLNVEAPVSLPDYVAIAKEIGIIGDEHCVREMLHMAYRYALRSIPVLITGETGTGKDLLARYIHRLSPRSEQPYITVNCAAITESLAESELFGVKKGAYTGATADRAGKFDAADRGTLFLDEIGDLPLEIQAKILRALENGEIQKVGDAKAQKVDVRIIAASNQDLHVQVRERLFRDDLLSRLSVGTIHVPPLRERRADIPLIAQHLMDIANRNEGVSKHLTPEALQLLTSSSWERWNVRELRTAIERAWTMAEGDTVDYHHFKILQPQSTDNPGFPLPDLNSSFNWQTYLDELRERVFSKALEMGGGNASAAARILGVTPQAVSQFQQRQK